MAYNGIQGIVLITGVSTLFPLFLNRFELYDGG
jgi:hypothetical protein